MRTPQTVGRMKLRLPWTPQKINNALMLGQIKRNGYAITHAPTDAREKKKGNLVIGKKRPARGSTKSFYERRRKIRIFPRSQLTSPPYVRGVISREENLPALTTDLPTLRARCVCRPEFFLYIF